MIYKKNKMKADRYLDDIFGGDYSQDSSKEMSQRIIRHFSNENYDVTPHEDINNNKI